MTKEQVLQAFRENHPVTLNDSWLYQIVEVNLNNGEVLLDKVLFDNRKSECQPYHLPKVLAKWEDLCTVELKSLDLAKVLAQREGLYTVGLKNSDLERGL